MLGALVCAVVGLLLALIVTVSSAPGRRLPQRPPGLARRERRRSDEHDLPPGWPALFALPRLAAALSTFLITGASSSPSSPPLRRRLPGRVLPPEWMSNILRRSSAST
jgi:hypothetical protein